MKFRLSIAVLLLCLLSTVALAQSPLRLLPSGTIPPAGNTPCNQDTAPQSAPANVSARHVTPADAYSTAFAYLTTFYPRWFTYYQAAGPCNRIVGPVRVSPLYQSVVAINDDTFYASAFVAVKKEPTIVTVPATTDNYSVLQLDQYGNVFDGIPNNQPGIYGLTGPEWQGTLPNGVIQVKVPYDYTELIFRADKYVKNGDTYVDMSQEAKTFRSSLHSASLSDWLMNHDAGPAKILPELFFAVPYKTLAVLLIANQPIDFLTSLQTAVQAGTTQPLSTKEKILAAAFNQLFQDQSNYPQMIAGAQDAHKLIDANYLTNFYPNTTWVTFTDIGQWNTDAQGYLNRSSITDYIQYGNNHDAAVYYQNFLDVNKKPLDGTNTVYSMTFLNNGQPDVSRFWSLTAYLPISIELVPNEANKYVVASYTPNLQTAPDGSVTIIMSNTPLAANQANWLPIPKGRFSVMLRAYGPQGSVLNNMYSPPPIVPMSTTQK